MASAPNRIRTLLPAILLLLAITACGPSAPTPTTPPPTATIAPTVAPTATRIATRPAATATRASSSPVVGTPSAPNPAAVTAAYTTLQKQSSYHLEIKVVGLGSLLPLGIGNTLTYTIDANGSDQKIVIDDGSGTTQEGYRVGGKTYLVTNGQAVESTSLPLLFTLPDLLYSSLTAQGVMTFTLSGDEQMNGRSTVKYQGNGSIARLAANPLFALALPNAQGEVHGPLWVDKTENFLVAADFTITLTTPQAGTAKMRLDVTRVGQVGPITLPR